MNKVPSPRVVSMLLTNCACFLFFGWTLDSGPPSLICIVRVSVSPSLMLDYLYSRARDCSRLNTDSTWRGDAMKIAQFARDVYVYEHHYLPDQTLEIPMEDYQLCRCLCHPSRQ